MAARKPWESSVPMSSQPIPPSLNNINQGLLPSVESNRVQGAPPPPPPRANQSYLPQQQSMGFYSPSNYMSPYSMGSLYGQQSYFSPFNNYRLSPYGPQGNLPTSNFAQLAMDESRSAFSSIESVIHTFRSISYMLESTFTSVYSSFRAVTDVIDHFTRVRTEITSIYPLVLIGRFLKYLYHRLLRLLHLRRSMPGATEETWSHIYQSLQQANAVSAQGAPRTSSSSLLIALFFLVSFGVPMLMLKLLNSIIQKRQDASNWLEKEANPARVIAQYDYVAQNSDELSFSRGTTIYLAPIAFQSTNSNWFLGTIDRIHTGLIPANYVQPVRSSGPSSITLHPQTPLNGTNSDVLSQPAPASSSSPLISTNNS